MNHGELVTLTAWMAERGFQASEIAYAVEKPWKWAAELEAAKHEATNDGHQTDTSEDPFTCGDCDWTVDR